MIEQRGNGLLLWCGDLKSRLMNYLARQAPRDRPLAELSGGSAALALARLAAQRGQDCRLYLPAGHPDRTRLEAMGAEVRVATLPQALAELTEDHQAGRVHWMRQNFRVDAWEAYTELLTPYRSLTGVRILVASVGTGASLRALAAAFPDRPVLALFSTATPGVRPLDMDLGGTDAGSRASLERDLGQRLYCLEVGAVDSGQAVREAVSELRGALGLLCHSARPASAVTFSRSKAIINA